MADTGYDYENMRWDLIALFLIGMCYRVLAWFFLKFTHSEKQGSYPLFTNISKSVRRMYKRLLPSKLFSSSSSDEDSV